jgi:hypothetical protein
MPTTFKSQEAEAFWKSISGTLDRFMDVVADCSVEELNWRPPAPETNSIYVLAVHTLANARQNVLGKTCGQDVTRNRDEEFVQVATEENASIPWWPQLRADIEQALAGIEQSRLDARIEDPDRGTVFGREYLLLVARHAAEHVGQAELTRDLSRASMTG